jgi:hypothetical protein
MSPLIRGPKSPNRAPNTPPNSPPLRRTTEPAPNGPNANHGGAGQSIERTTERTERTEAPNATRVLSRDTVVGAALCSPPDETTARLSRAHLRWAVPTLRVPARGAAILERGRASSGPAAELPLSPSPGCGKPPRRGVLGRTCCPFGTLEALWGNGCGVLANAGQTCRGRFGRPEVPFPLCLQRFSGSRRLRPWVAG